MTKRLSAHQRLSAARGLLVLPALALLGCKPTSVPVAAAAPALISSSTAGWADVTSYGAGNGSCRNSQGLVDDALCIQAAINDVAKQGGGTVFFPSASYTTRSTIYIGNTAVTPAAGAAINLQGANRISTTIQFNGSSGGPIVSTIVGGTAHFAVRDLSLQYATAGLPNSKCLDLVDAIYFDVANVSCWNVQSSQQPTANTIIGIDVRSCQPPTAPPIGYGHIGNFIAYSPESALGSFQGSYGILIDGSGAQGAGCRPASVVNVAIDGYGDIENFQTGIGFRAAANNSVGGQYWIGGGDHGVAFTQAAYNTVSHARLQYETGSSGSGCIQSGAQAGVGCAVFVDGNSYDNTIEYPDFFAPNDNAVLDQGVRTVWITSGDGTQPTRLPRLSTPALAIGDGTEIKRHLSSTDVTGTQPAGTQVQQNGGVWQWLPGSPGTPGTIAAGGFSAVNITVDGATTGGVATVSAGFANALQPGILVTGAVTAPNTVTVTMFNATGAPYSGAGWGQVRADVWLH
jgi:hypothetical protein